MFYMLISTVSDTLNIGVTVKYYESPKPQLQDTHTGAKVVLWLPHYISIFNS